jgi:predicted ribosomally synthesized peptide with nif11-like leader
MSLEILEKVKDFLVKLVKDEAFRSQLINKKVEEAEQVLQEKGYNFSQEEFETAAIQILELKELGQFNELSEEELVGAVGGIASIAPEDSIVQPLYGVISWPPKGYPKPWPKPWPRPLPKPFPQPQPLYGIVISPLDLTSQASDT